MDPAERTLGREREHSAEHAGAAVACRAELASSLVEVHAFDGQWEAVERRFRMRRPGEVSNNASLLFAAWVHEASRADALKELDAHQISNPTDTHPRLSARIEALECTLAEVTTAALTTAPEQSSVQLFDNHEELEISLTNVYRENIERQQHEIAPPSFGMLEP